MKKRLTPKQQRFVDEYLVDLNATQAALRAGYSPKTAGEIGRQNLGKLAISSEIDAAQAKLAEKTGVTVQEIARELALIGFANSGDYFDWGPKGVKLKPKESLTRDQQAVVAEISETKSTNGGTIKLKLHDKQAALVNCGRHLGMFKDKLDIGGNISFHLNFAGEPGTLIEGEAVEVHEIEGEE